MVVSCPVVTGNWTWPGRVASALNHWALSLAVLSYFNYEVSIYLYIWVASLPKCIFFLEDLAVLMIFYFQLQELCYSITYSSCKMNQAQHSTLIQRILFISLFYDFKIFFISAWTLRHLYSLSSLKCVHGTVVYVFRMMSSICLRIHLSLTWHSLASNGFHSLASWQRFHLLTYSSFKKLSRYLGRL